MTEKYIRLDDVMTIIARKHLFKDKTDFDKCVHAIAEQIKTLPTVEPQEWISVKDRLPNEDCECWITLEYIKTGNRVLYESHYDLELEKFYNQKCLERQGYKLIAWQKKRMPSPYRGGKE